MTPSAASSQLDARFTEPDGLPPRQRLDEADAAHVRRLAQSLARSAPAELDEALLCRAAMLAHELPRRVLETFTAFRLTDRPHGGFILSGLDLDTAALGPTPASYTEPVDRPAVTVAEMQLLLIGSLLGNPFSFLTQQRGRLILDVFPVRSHEYEQLGSSSLTTLEWHTEDAFHNRRADWSLLLCLRNPSAAATTFAAIDTVEMPDQVMATLFQERFVIRPDVSHTSSFNAETAGLAGDERTRAAFERIGRMNAEPKRIAVLSGDPGAPFVRIDPVFMSSVAGDTDAEAALQEAKAAISARLHDVVLGPGELFVIDNLRAVHGRRPFTARYDGTDRWLKRLNLTADLRKTAGFRVGPTARAVV